MGSCGARGRSEMPYCRARAVSFEINTAAERPRRTDRLSDRVSQPASRPASSLATDEWAYECLRVNAMPANFPAEWSQCGNDRSQGIELDRIVVAV